MEPVLAQSIASSDQPAYMLFVQLFSLLLIIRIQDDF